MIHTRFLVRDVSLAAKILHGIDCVKRQQASLRFEPRTGDGVVQSLFRFPRHALCITTSVTDHVLPKSKIASARFALSRTDKIETRVRTTKMFRQQIIKRRHEED